MELLKKLNKMQKKFHAELRTGCDYVKKMKELQERGDSSVDKDKAFSVRLKGHTCNIVYHTANLRQGNMRFTRLILFGCHLKKLQKHGRRYGNANQNVQH